MPHYIININHQIEIETKISLHPKHKGSVLAQNSEIT